MKKLIKLVLLTLFLFLTSCAKPGIIAQLSKDPASACGYSTVTYGGGAVVIPSPAVPLVGVYFHDHWCRSNQVGSKVELKPDGTISVQHGVMKPEAFPEAPISPPAAQPTLAPIPAKP